MASTRRLPSGKFQGRYRDALGQDLSAGTFTQEKQAMRAAILAEEQSRQVDAVDTKGGKITWGAWFDTWHEARDVAYATDEHYRSIAVNHLKPQWGLVKLADIKELEIQRWLKKKQHPPKGTDPMSPWTARAVLMLFKTSLNAAVKAKRIGSNPAKDVPYPDLPEGLERFLTPEEVDAIAFNLSGVNALLAWTGVQTGMRIGEMAGLHWNRLDLERGAVNVVEVFDQKAMMISPVPKDKEKRTIPLPDDLVRLLANHRDHGRARQATCGIPHKVGKCSGDIVFRGGRGAPIRSSDWGKNVLKKAVRDGGVEGRVRVHDFRHTYASWLIQEGVSIPEVALRMGHSDWEVTQKYAHLGDDGFDKVKEALARKLNSPEPEPSGDLESRVVELERLVAELLRATPRATADPLDRVAAPRPA
ncbi:tyrosine-type recombinase/integrase [Amycolatopsis thailandensis]|uniref:tyrosine-type recombinase/integrase n=1 Tax=Amycolatopsis thailandensis TaxID=589330 RepID=UPI00379EB2F7